MEEEKNNTNNIDYQTVVDTLRVKGLGDPEARRLFEAWLDQEKKIAEEVKEGRANVVVSMEEAVLLGEAGLRAEALLSYKDALFMARQEGEEDLAEMIVTEIEKLERGTYDEQDLLREAKTAHEKRLSQLTDAVMKNTEMSKDDTDVMLSYMNNFHGHLPGGYKRIMSTGQLEKDIDDAIERLGFSRDEIVRWENDGPRNEEDGKKRITTLIALYIEMRRLGYEHYPTLSS